MIVLILAAIGFAISIYAYIVESKIKADSSYKPACDINDKISCTKALQSQYSNIFYFSNTLVGLAYYALVAVLTLMKAHSLLLVVSTGSVIVTCYLAYLLYVKVQSYCVVCTSIYIVNILIFLTVFMNR